VKNLRKYICVLIVISLLFSLMQFTFATSKTVAAKFTIVSIETVKIIVQEGNKVTLPATVRVHYSNKSIKAAKVSWVKLPVLKIGANTIYGTIASTKIKAKAIITLTAKPVAKVVPPVVNPEVTVPVTETTTPSATVETPAPVIQSTPATVYTDGELNKKIDGRIIFDSFYVPVLDTLSYFSIYNCSIAPDEIISIAGKDFISVNYLNKTTGIKVNQDLDNKTIKLYGSKTFNDGLLDFNANFDVQVSASINWIPVVALGKPTLTRDEIKALGNDPEKLQANIKTVYDAIEYLRVANFTPAREWKEIQEGNIAWGFPKPALTGIRTNSGGCAEIANLIHYLLKDDYDEEGYVTYTCADGNGHIYNYFMKNGKYYFVDFTEFLNSAPSDVHAKETGNMYDYRNSNYAQGNVHETTDPKAYVSYLNDSSNTNNKFVLSTMYCVDGDSLVMGQSKENGNLTDWFKKVDNFTVIYDDSTDNVFINFNNGPSVPYPTW